MNSKFVWATATADDKNTNVIFWLEIECKKAQKVELTMSAIDIYKLYVNEKFVLFGPARAAMGYSRSDTVECELCEGKNRIAVCSSTFMAHLPSGKSADPQFSAADVSAKTLLW